MKKNNLIKHMFGMFLLLAASPNVCAQTSSGFIPTDFQGYCFSPQNLGFATPQTAEFVQFGNTNVNYYNGLLDLDIPLFGYKDTAFELDMSIKYISDGFKPGRRPSMVGNNWILNVGGSITRNVKGNPDDVRQEHKNGLLAAIRDGNFKQYSKEDLLNLNIPHATKNRLYPEPEYDMAPDIFDFNFGRHKGRFIIDNAGNAKCISGGGYRIDLSGMTVQDYSKTNALKRSVITITTPDGYLYTFGEDTSSLEYSVPNNPGKLRSRPVQITSWYLSSIRDETRKHLLTFSYQSRLQKNKYHFFVKSYMNGTQWIYYRPDKNGYTKPPESRAIGDRDTDHFLMEDKVYTPIIETISAGDVKINFATETFPVNFFGDSDGNDLIYLSGITMTENANTIKSCKFDYQTSGRYFFLKKATLHDQSENPGIYSFDYDVSSTLPDPLTTSVDHWGFWNGGYEIINNADTYLSDGNFNQRKAVNTAVSECTMLKTITYPTKGEEKIGYEYNRYRYYLTKRIDSYAWDTNTTTYDTPFGGVRIKSLTLHDPSTEKDRHRSFSYLDPTTGTESGRTHELPRYHMPDERMVYYSSHLDYTEERTLNVYSVSSNSIGRFNNISEYPIGYSYVAETFDDGSFCRYHFSSLADVPDNAKFGKSYIQNPVDLRSRSFGFNQIVDKALNYTPNDLSAFRGKLLSKETHNNRYHKVATEEYKYNLVDNVSDYEVSIENNTGVFLASKIFTVPCLLIQEILTDDNGVEILHNFKYNNYGFVTQKETVNSNGDHVYLKSFYPEDPIGLYPDEHYNNLKSSNRIEDPIAFIKYVQKAGENERRIVDAIQFLYEPFKDCGIQKRSVLKFPALKTLPENTDFSKTENMLQLMDPVEAYDNYDYYGNLITYRSGNEENVYLWKNEGRDLEAEIKGSTYQEVKDALGISPEYYSLSYNTSRLIKLKEKLIHAHVTIYDYKSQVGMKYVSTPAGKESYFQYDSYGRLKKSFRRGKDGELQLLNFNKYHYAK